MTAIRSKSLVGKARLSIALTLFAATVPTRLVAQSTVSAPTQLTRSDNIQLPTLGDGSEMSSSVERRLGDRIAREIYRDPDYIDDPVLADYVQSIWQPLLSAARSRGELSSELDQRFAWEILLARDRTVNAFALPGGYFGVHLGLIAVVTSRDELASVLGHELSHVTQRHISRLMAKQSQQTPWMIGAMILGALAASKSPDAANALIVGGQAVAAQNQLNFSRDMEREADRVGFGVMTQAGFEAQGFVSMFDKLQQASRLNDNGAYPYLRSHPLTTERIADMQARQLLGSSNASNSTPEMEHAMVAVRARILSNPGVDALRAIAEEARGTQWATLSISRQAAVLYGASLALSRLRESSLAQDYLARLSELVRSDAPAARLSRLLEMEVALAADNVQRAAALLDGLAPKTSISAGITLMQQRPELFLSAQLATQASTTGHANQAAQGLQIWVLAHPHDAQAWQLLSSVYSVQGQTLRAIRADAEAQVARLDYVAALDRFKAAQELMRKSNLGDAGRVNQDHIESSIIDTRKRQVELLLKEQSLDR
jgi:predicted Zn-dependent protease